MHPAWEAPALTANDVKRELAGVIREDLRRQERLLHEYILLDPTRHGVDQARLMPVDVSVWVIAVQLEGAKGNIHEVADAYRLLDEAVEAALIFYRRNRTAIDARWAENQIPGAEHVWQPDTMPQP